MLKRITFYIEKYFRWISTGLFLVITSLFILNKLYSPAIDWLGNLVGGKDTFILTALFSFVVLILDKQYELNEKFRAIPLLQYKTEAKAYKALSEIIAHRNVKSIDLLQVSGQTALPLLNALADSHPGARIRLLLLHKDVSHKFDTDESNENEYFDHVARAVATKSHLKTLTFNSLEIKYYRSYPSVCSVVVDDKIVCLGWYRMFFESSEIMRVRSHNVPAILALDHDADSLLVFAKSHFNKMWEFAEDDIKANTKTVLQV